MENTQLYALLNTYSPKGSFLFWIHGTVIYFLYKVNTLSQKNYLQQRHFRYLTGYSRIRDLTKNSYQTLRSIGAGNLE
jgi:hypothetical protein